MSQFFFHTLFLFKKNNFFFPASTSCTSAICFCSYKKDSYKQIIKRHVKCLSSLWLVLSSLLLNITAVPWTGPEGCFGLKINLACELLHLRTNIKLISRREVWSCVVWDTSNISVSPLQNQICPGAWGKAKGSWILHHCFLDPLAW